MSSHSQPKDPEFRSSSQEPPHDYPRADQRQDNPRCHKHSTPLVCLTCLRNIPGTTERHYSPKELAARFGCSAMTIRRWFAEDPGVVLVRSPQNIRGRKRRYVLMLIPESCVHAWIAEHNAEQE